MGTTRIPSLFPNPTGILIVLFLATAAFAGEETSSPRQPAWVETGIDRPGSDFKILWLRGGPGSCQEACAQNPLCRSYTYVRAGVAGRMEGCWLKDAVPPAVEDGCCVSGVKTGETVSHLMRETVIPPAQTDRPPTGPKETEAAPEPAPVEPERTAVRLPETGSGKRGTGGMNYASAPPAIGESAGSGFSSAVSPPSAEMGAGRRGTAGMHFSANPPSSGPPGRTPESADERFPGAATGRRASPGLHYTASPPTGREAGAEILTTGSATRRVGGVDITAVPPQRHSMDR